MQLLAILDVLRNRNPNDYKLIKFFLKKGLIIKHKIMNTLDCTQKARIVNSKYDLLFKNEKNKSEIYDLRKNGIWELIR